MDTLVIPLALICSLGLGGVALSVAAILHAASSARELDRRSRAQHAQLQAAFETAQAGLRQLASEVRQIQEQSPVTLPACRSGLNLSTRSQALRMHRRGENAAQIAAALQVPAQEVELLLKVHRIVVNTLIGPSQAEGQPGRPSAA